MDNRPIGVFDSGIGGLPVLKKLTQSFTEEDFIYLGDNDNVPYGSRDRDEIKELAMNGINELFSRGVKCVVVACNTASMALAEEKMNNVVLLQPHVDKNFSLGKSGLFIATPRTVEQVKKNNLFSFSENIAYLPLPNLATEIENGVFCDHFGVLLDHHINIKQTFDFVYLGCTHYLYLKQQITDFLKVDKTLDGIDFLVEKLTKYLENYNFYANGFGTVSFAGKNLKTNLKVYSKFFS